MKPWRALLDVLTDAVAGDHDPGDLAELVYSAVGRYVPFDFACFALTDPATGLVTWASKTRSLGVGDEEFAAVEYGPPDINSFADIAGQHRLSVSRRWTPTATPTDAGGTGI